MTASRDWQYRRVESRPAESFDDELSNERSRDTRYVFRRAGATIADRCSHRRAEPLSAVTRRILAEHVDKRGRDTSVLDEGAIGDGSLSFHPIAEFGDSRGSWRIGARAGRDQAA